MAEGRIWLLVFGILQIGRCAGQGLGAPGRRRRLGCFCAGATLRARRRRHWPQAMPGRQAGAWGHARRWAPQQDPSWSCMRPRQGLRLSRAAHLSCRGLAWGMGGSRCWRTRLARVQGTGRRRVWRWRNFGGLWPRLRQAAARAAWLVRCWEAADLAGRPKRRQERFSGLSKTREGLAWSGSSFGRRGRRLPKQRRWQRPWKATASAGRVEGSWVLDFVMAKD